MKRRTVLAAGLLAGLPAARAHHGWDSFDQSRPLYLEGRVARVSWRHPHAELDLELHADLKLPAGLAARKPPAQNVPLDGVALLKTAQLPTRRDRLWHVELAPLTRMDAWKVAPIPLGQELAVLGYSGTGEKGDALLRAEYLFIGDKVYAMRSPPA